MGLKESIEKLLEGGNEDDMELAAMLLESDDFSIEEKKQYIEKFINENPGEFTTKEMRFLRTWLDTKIDNNAKQKLKLWILKTP